jgi:two-component system chemotaxis sensor kinase CheA
MTEAQIHKFIFVPGFSTAGAVTSVSGRGVGMDVVRNNIDQIGGTIDVKSVPGEGSSFTIRSRPASGVASRKAPAARSVLAGVQF